MHPWAIPTGDYLVPVPRVTDAIGEALRGSYRGGQPLTDAMLALLRTLDAAGRA